MLEGAWFAESVLRVPGFLEPLKDVTIKDRKRGDEGYWEVVMPRQPEYVDEVGWLNEVVRERGLRCLVRV